MPGYVIANVVEIMDPESFERCHGMVEPTVEEYGGRYVVRGGATEVLEGAWTSERLVVLEFPSCERARSWYESESYRPARELREQATRTEIVIAEGV